MRANGTRRIGGRYELVEPLGRGGMGVVWRAQDSLLGRPVAVKEVVPPVGLSPEEREVLREHTMREARAAARIHSTSAVTVYDVVEQDGHPWIVMELLEARSLAEVLRDDGPLEPQHAARVGLAVLDALVAAHRAGVVHRDVKPANVLLGPGERVVLTDFGVAALDGDAAASTTGTVLGSPAYMAPERAQARPPAPAMDLWSLGVTLYAAVEGRSPFQRESPMGTVQAVLHDPVPAPRRAGPLAPVIMGLLVRDPDRRLNAASARRLLEQSAYAPRPDPEATQVVPLPLAPAPASADQAVPVPVPAQVRDDDRRIGVSGNGVAANGAVGNGSVGNGAVGNGNSRAGDGSPVAAPAPVHPPARVVPEPAAARVSPDAQTEARPVPLPPVGADSTTPVVAPVAGWARDATTEVRTPADTAPQARSPMQTGTTPLEVRRVPEDTTTEVRTPFGAGGVPRTVPLSPVPAPPVASGNGRAAASAGRASDRVGGPWGPGDGAAGDRGDDGAPAERRRRRRGGLGLLAGLVALLAAGALIVGLLSSRGGSAQTSPAPQQSSPAPPTPAASAPPAPTGQTGIPSLPAPASTAPSAQASADRSPSATRQSPSGASTAAAVPAGFRQHEDPTGFSVAVPQGWDVRTERNQRRFYDDTGRRLLSIDQTQNPKPDPEADWRAQEPRQAPRFPGYQRVSIDSVNYRGWDTADWEFTWVGESGTKYHVRNRGVITKPGERAYALYFSAPEDQWEENQRLFDQIAASFQPAD